MKTRRDFLRVAAAAGIVAISGGLAERVFISGPRRAHMTPGDAAYAALTSPAANSTDHDVLAYKARTAAFLLNAGYTAAEDAGGYLDALWAARYSPDTSPGYGLSSAWDAFGDGTIDPATTIYTYSTAMAALAFLDGAGATGDDTYRGYADQLADTLTTSCWGYTNGARQSVWYSDQAADKKAGEVVHNVNALTLAVLARLGRDADKQAGIKAMLASTIEPDGKWRYSLNGPTYNDLEHSSFIAEGTVAAGMPEAQPALAHVWAFFNTNGTFNTANSDVMGSTRWGPPDGLAALAMAPEWRTQAGLIANVLTASIGSNGVSSYADATNPRSVAHYGVGLARYAAVTT